jgi:subtilisin family serine protease
MLKVAVVALLVVSVLGLAPLYEHKDNYHRGSETSYIVVLHSHAPPNVTLGVSADQIQATYDMGESFRGFSVWLTASELMLVRNHRDVSYVEEDTTFSIDPIMEGEPTEMDDVDWLTRPDWGTMRVDQRARNLATTPAGLYENGQYASAVSTTWDWNGPKWAPPAAGNVWVYVLDTGTYSAHNEFGGRAERTYDVIADGQAPTGDCNGHGTHCSGSIGGKNRGVAVGALIQGVRVLNCQGSGSTTNIVRGIQWIVQQHQAKRSTASILSASLGGGLSTALNDAVNSAATNGVIPVVAAGNSNVDAANTSPASASGAITIGATGSNDTIASFSNWGSKLKAFSPGVTVHSAYIGSPSTYSALSGTSMATPLAAGALAVLAQLKGGLTPTQAVQAIADYATPNVVGGLAGKTGSPNRLIYDKWQ